MKLNKDKIKSVVDEVAGKWDISGNFFLMKEEEILYKNHYGYANRELKVPTKTNTSYTMDSLEAFFVSLAILIAIQNKKLKLEDTLDKFIPDFKHSSKISIENLLRQQSGLVDFFYEKLMVILEVDPDYVKLSDHNRIRKETKTLYMNRSFDTVYRIIKDCDLDFEPGIKTRESLTNFVVLSHVLKEVTKQEPFDYLLESVFKPLNMTSVTKGFGEECLSYKVYQHHDLVSLPINYEIDGLFHVSVDDMLKLFSELSGKRILSKSLWKTILKYDKDDGGGIIFSDANGYHTCSMTFQGFSFSFYMNDKTNITFGSILNENQKFEVTDGSWNYFNKDLREGLSSLIIYPLNTKMRPLNKQNFWKATGLTIEKEQNDFVLDAKTSLAMGLMYSTKKVFVQMEDMLVVGLLVLDIDKKKKDYNVDIIIIDKHYQGKGYGKLMVKWAVEYLKNAGATTLTIGVSRRNIAAKKIYMNAGFKPKAIDTEGMELEIKL